MRESCTYGSVGALGGQPPRTIRPPFGTLAATRVAWGKGQAYESSSLRKTKPPVGFLESAGGSSFAPSLRRRGTPVRMIGDLPQAPGRVAEMALGTFQSTFSEHRAQARWLGFGRFCLMMNTGWLPRDW